MDWTTILVATVPAVITGLISGFASYLSATSKAKNEIKKAKVDQETAIQTIERQAQHEIEKIRTSAQHEIETYKAKIQADGQKTENDMMLGIVQEMFRGAMQNPQQSLESVRGLQQLVQEFEKFQPQDKVNK